ncbi:MAG: sulfatase-like hydrolase/transferase, partial [Chitinophagales bacterium]
PDIYETQLSDYVGTDSAISFINQVSEGTANICDNKPFFLAIGYHQPHAGRIVPEKYFHDFYMDDNYEYPLDLPYNEPYNAYPPNGVIMPPQPPEGKWADFEAFPEASISKSFADNTETEENFSDYISSLSSLPLVAPGLSSEEVVDVLMESERANFVTNYLASIKYIDAQIGRLMDELNAHPALVENTIIIFLSDHGYSLGEKKHYTKWALWETDIRTPMIIVDPSRTGNKVSSRTVSLLDIFPTVLDLAGVNHPKFDDGSEYLDGTSLIPLLINVSKQWEKPALVSTLKNCSMPLCDPDYSVRNERFHYIRYHHDDTASFIYDSLGNDILEQELYEIGTKRETDPNEWTNLAYDPDYAPVIAYLDNFFPDSSMYLQKAQKVEISNGPISCLLTNTGKLKLKLKLYNADGVLVSGPTLSGYSYKWTNNITAGTSFGINYNFPLNTIPIATYTTTDKIIFYIHVYEITTGKLVAFDTKTFYLNPVNAPSIFYNAYVSGMQVSIEDYSLTGSFKSSSWDFGDGGIMEEFLPAAHTYSTPGTYTIKNTVFYGNGCSTISSKTVTILEDVKTTEEVLGVSDFNMRVFPNPANQTITLVYDPQYTGISIAILNSFGQVMLNKTTDLSGAIDISGLPAGNYIIKLTHSGGYETSIFEVMR